MEEVNKKNKIQYENLRNYDKQVQKVNVTENIFENDIKNSDKLIKLKLQNFKILNDIESVKSRFVSDQKFNFYLENLDNLINKNLNGTNLKNNKVII